MQGPGYWGNHYWNPNYWPDNYWHERESEPGPPRILLYPDKGYVFRAMKAFTFPALKQYSFLASKLFTYPVSKRDYTFNAEKRFIFNSGAAMTTPSMFEKLPSETYSIAVEWANQLPFGATLATGTVAARKMDDNSDVTGTVLTSPTATISGTQSRIKVTGGKVHTKYRLLFTVVLSNGEQLQEAVYMQVREP